MKLKAQDIRPFSIILIDSILYYIQYTVKSKDKKNVVFYLNEIDSSFGISEKLIFKTYSKDEFLDKLEANTENLFYELNENRKTLKELKEVIENIEKQNKEKIENIIKSLKKTREEIKLNDLNDFYSFKG
jgi:hemerythrin-like domain-containing protein